MDEPERGRWAPAARPVVPHRPGVRGGRLISTGNSNGLYPHI